MNIIYFNRLKLAFCLLWTKNYSESAVSALTAEWHVIVVEIVVEASEDTLTGENIWEVLCKEVRDCPAKIGKFMRHVWIFWLQIERFILLSRHSPDTTKFLMLTVGIRAVRFSG